MKVGNLRFSALGDQTEKQTDFKNLNGVRILGANLGADPENEIWKGNEGESETLDRSNGYLNEVDLCVFHEELMVDLRTLGLSRRRWVGFISGREKKNKYKALKDFSNKLVSNPIKLKPAWTGPKLQTKPTNKDTWSQKWAEKPNEQAGMI